MKLTSLFTIAALGALVTLNLAGCAPHGTDATTAATSPVTANGQERGGGDADEIRSDLRDDELEQLIDKLEWAFTNPAANSVRRSTSALLGRASRLPKGIAKTAILDMVARGAIPVLWKTKFLFAKECVDTFEGKKRSATAVMNPTSADQFEICINLEKIAADLGPQITDGELVGLIVHELAHFYGYRDADRKIATTVAKFMIQEASATDGESLFFLVPTEHQPRMMPQPKVSGISQEAADLRGKIGDVALKTDRELFEKLWRNAQDGKGATANWIPDLDDDLLRATSVSQKNADGSITTCHRAPPLDAYLTAIRSVVFPSQYVAKPEGAVENPGGRMSYRCDVTTIHN